MKNDDHKSGRNSQGLYESASFFESKLLCGSDEEIVIDNSTFFCIYGLCGL